jgi:hypothetical protein
MDDKYVYQPLQEASNNQQSQGSSPKLFSLPHKYLALLVAVLCLTSLGSAILLLSDHNKEDKTLVSLFRENILRFPSPTPTPQQLLEGIDETFGWNVYSNSQYGYSIKYPLDWNGVITPQGDPKILEYVVFNPLSATRAGELSITLTYTTRSYKEVLDSDPQPGETIIVSSISATRKLKEDSQRRVSISVAIPDNSNTLVLLGKEKYKDIFNKMLSTFKLEAR